MSLNYQNDARRKREKNDVCTEAWRTCERGTLKCRISELHDIDSVISRLETRDFLNAVDNLEPLLDAFFSVVPNEEDEIAWKKFGSDLCGLALKILKAVEQTDNFQSHFCKLLPSIGVICRRSSGTWHQVLRPLLKIFTNKKLDFVHLKGTVTELKRISKYAESSEMAIFTRQNLSLLQGFYKLAFRAGDFLLQMDILEIVFICAAGDKRLAEAVLAPPNPTVRQLLETLPFLDFEKDSRIFLNALNASLATHKRVFSINCKIVYFGNLSLSAPLGMDGIWVDVNRDSRRITIFCSDFLSNPDGDERVVLRLPLSGIEKLKLEFAGECYCITIKIGSLTEIYEFAKGRTMVCTAPSTKNPRDAVTDFVRVVEELSAEIRERAQEGKKFPPHFRSEKTGFGDVSECQAQKRKPSCTSPVIFSIGSIGKNAGKKTLKRNRMSRTSPLILPQESKETNRTQPGKTERDEANIKSTFQIKNIHFQVHRFSSSPSNNANDHRERIFKLKRNELSNQSIPKVERQRLAHGLFCENEEARHEKGQNGESSEEYRRRRHLTAVARICEDFILTDEFEVEDSGNVETKAPKRDAENTTPTGGRVKINTEKVKEKSCLSAKKKRSKVEERWKTSLLDTNGYAYRRWLRPTTSERSNFWLKKLKDPHITVSKPETDVFHFSEEGGISDDSNLFLKGMEAKGRKVGRASGREWRKQRDPKGKPTETRITASNFKKMVNSKGRERESKTRQLQLNSRIRMGTYKKVIASRDEVSDEFHCETDAPTFSDVLSLNDKPRKGQNSGGGEAESQTVATFATKRKITSSGENQCSPSPPQVRNKETPKTRCLEELDDIEKSLSSGFEKLLQEMGEREARCARKYAKEIEERMRALTEEEEEEMANRSTRFELCIQYFFEGCSALDSNGDLQAEMEKRVESVANLNGREGYLQKKVTGFVGKLREIIAEGAEATFNKQMKTGRIHQFQDLLSYNFSERFHSHSQHFF